MKVYYTHRMPPTCFGHSYDHLQEGILQKTDKSKYYRRFESVYRYKITNFNNNTLFKIHIKELCAFCTVHCDTIT